MAAPRNSGADATFSMLGADLAIKGDIAASADLHIDGKIEGDISCNSLVQGEKSEIIGAVTAQSARLSGRIEGSIDCRELVVLKTARVVGDVRYDALTIEQGAVIDGHLTPHGAEPRTSKDAPDAVTEPVRIADAAE